MAKVTTKLQVTVPKALAERFGIRPGSQITWEAGPDAIRVVPTRASAVAVDVGGRLERFDQATARQRARQRTRTRRTSAERGWTREELYGRGRAR